MPLLTTSKLPLYLKFGGMTCVPLALRHTGRDAMQ